MQQINQGLRGRVGVSDVERLEEIKENAIKEKTHIKHIETGESRWGHTYTLMDTDFGWLISTVEKQQKEIEGRIRFESRRVQQVNNLIEQNKRYREAIEKMKDKVKSNGVV